MVVGLFHRHHSDGKALTSGQTGHNRVSVPHKTRPTRQEDQVNSREQVADETMRRGGVVGVSLQIGMSPSLGLFGEIETVFAVEDVGSAIVAGVEITSGAIDTELDLAEMSLESVIGE